MTMEMSFFDTPPHACSLVDLPEDTIIYICKYLNGIDIITMSQVSKNFRFLIRQNINYFGISHKLWDTQFMIANPDTNLYQHFINQSVDSIVNDIAFGSNIFMIKENKRKIYDFIKKGYIRIKFLNKILDLSSWCISLHTTLSISKFCNTYPEYYDIAIELAKKKHLYVSFVGYFKEILEWCYHHQTVFDDVIYLIDNNVDSWMSIYYLINYCKHDKNKMNDALNLEQLGINDPRDITYILDLAKTKPEIIDYVKRLNNRFSDYNTIEILKISMQYKEVIDYAIKLLDEGYCAYEAYTKIEEVMKSHKIKN